MAKEDDRIRMLIEGADTIVKLMPTDGEVANIAHNMRKAAAFIVDRDAKANLEARSEITRLRHELSLANGVAKEIDYEFLAYREKTKPMAQAYSAMKSENSNLRTELALKAKT